MAAAALSFMLGLLRGYWHSFLGHRVEAEQERGRVVSLYCPECSVFLWVKA